MLKSRSVINVLLTLVLFVDASGPAIPLGKKRDAGPSPQMPGSEMQVTLSSAQRTTSWDNRDPARQEFDLPLLYLHRERKAAAETDRTLVLDLSGVEGGDEIEVEVVSRHADPSTGARFSASRIFVLSDRLCTLDEPCTVRWTFDAEMMLSDLYNLRVRDRMGNLLWKNRYLDRPDFVALDTWELGIDAHTVRVYYAVLFPFAMGKYDLDNRLPPGAVTDFVERQFMPMVVNTWHTQFHSWGFGPIHPDWDGDKVVQVYVTAAPFALFGGTGTYTRSVYSDGRPYPERRLWWYAGNNSFQAYDTLENGYKAVFAHEFFHMVQWNAQLSTGCSTHRAWRNVFIEAQGKFVPSVQYPEIEMHRDHVDSLESEYLSAANRFLKLGLNTSYRAFEAARTAKYDMALYWRFLYEQFGDMGIVRASLEEMACRDHPDIEASLDKVMDAALARSNGPFQTFEESLTAFAQANYALRLANGRCTAGDIGACGGHYYDPHHMYAAPPLEAALDYEGTLLTFSGSIPASFGIDLVGDV